jgi:hypothetical protein
MTARSREGLRQARTGIHQVIHRPEEDTVRHQDACRRRGEVTGRVRERILIGRSPGQDLDHRGLDRHGPDQGRGRQGLDHGAGRHRGGIEGDGTLHHIGVEGGGGGHPATALTAATAGAGAEEGMTEGDSGGNWSGNCISYCSGTI